MSHNPSASDIAIAGRDRVRAVLQGHLRAAQSFWTDESLSSASGVPARTIKSYRVEGKDPCLTNALSLAVVLGPKAVNGILSTIGYGGAKPLDEADTLDVPRIVATGLGSFAVIANAAVDGRIDHTEAKACREAADEIIATILPLSSAGDAA